MISYCWIENVIDEHSKYWFEKRVDMVITRWKYSQALQIVITTMTKGVRKVSSIKGRY